MDKEILIIHPSRGRAELAIDVKKSWLSKADKPGNIQYLFSLDSDNVRPYLLAGGELLEFYSNNNKSAIEAINFAVQSYSVGHEWDICIVVSDDFSCPEHWDTLLLKALKDKEDFCVKTRDGIQKTLMTLPIMDRKYYERFGYIYYPGYKHMFCDQEMTAVAHMLGRNLDVDLTFPHNHYSTGKFKKDAISIKNDSTWRQGELLFNERLKTNFGIENPVCQYSDIVWK